MLGKKRGVLGDTYPTVSAKKGKIIHYATSRSRFLVTGLQTQIWLQCGKATTRLPSPQDYGWIWDEEKNAVVPIWFTGTQLPTSLTKKSRKGNKEATIEDEGLILPKLCMSICILYECRRGRKRQCDIHGNIFG